MIHMHTKVSTGMVEFDKVIDYLRLGDNVVWQVDSEDDYDQVVKPFVRQALKEKRKLVYVNYNTHEARLNNKDILIYYVDPSKGFESFAAEVHNIVAQEGKKAFYVFDCLSDLLQYWYSDSMIRNFFKVTCPFLYELDTVAYFAIKRNMHTFQTIAGIRETTQLLLDLYQVNDELYIHPLKVWDRYSPSMFFPHLIKENETICITSSSEVSGLFASIQRGENRPDYWNIVFNDAKEALRLPADVQEAVKKPLISMLLGSESRMFKLCSKYFSLNDILMIASREIGTGLIGGKSIGMLVARKILEKEGQESFGSLLEHHDSFYLGADIFYAYIVENGWWRLRIKQKTPEGYFTYAPELKEKLKRGRFPKDIQEQFVQMLEYFGQSPIIVRSSSLLEDNFGNAFAGKYESIFCVNQGTPEERYEAFEQAVRNAYASTMNEDALNYRINRGLAERDEQMAILVQRVSGDQYGEYFFPHVAGVGNSSNLYVWDPNMDMQAGMLRLVFGLGTRAVDRTVGDYARIICLDDPLRNPPIELSDQKKYSQHQVDVLSLKDNVLLSKKLEEILVPGIKVDKDLFASVDIQTADRLRELGYAEIDTSLILDFKRLLKETKFPSVMKEMLAVLSSAYDYPVDIEFTANFAGQDKFKINLLQCRPLQTKGLGKPVQVPVLENPNDCFFRSNGGFMGGNVRLPIDYVVHIRAEAYSSLPDRQKYEIARQVGALNKLLKNKNALLIGPGRWGTTTPSLGLPVNFSELSNMSVICEVASKEAGFMPELSYGSHFFQDIVESGIFYVAIFDWHKKVIYNPGYILEKINVLEEILPGAASYSGIIHVSATKGMELFSDIVTQTVLCR